MPETSSLANSSHVKHVFEKSPKMSTYLVAWTVGDLVNVSNDVETMEGKKTVKVWTTSNR